MLRITTLILSYCGNEMVPVLKGERKRSSDDKYFFRAILCIPNWFSSEYILKCKVSLNSVPVVAYLCASYQNSIVKYIVYQAEATKRL